MYSICNATRAIRSGLSLSPSGFTRTNTRTYTRTHTHTYIYIHKKTQNTDQFNRCSYISSKTEHRSAAYCFLCIHNVYFTTMLRHVIVDRNFKLLFRNRVFESMKQWEFSILLRTEMGRRKSGLEKEKNVIGTRGRNICNMA